MHSVVRGAGKFILLGAIFGLVDESLTIAATLSTRSPFVAPYDKRDLAGAEKRAFAIGQSDHLAALHAYKQFDAIEGPAKFEYARSHFLGIKTLQTIGALKRQLLELLSAAGFVETGMRTRAVEAVGRRHGGSDGVDAVMRYGLDAAFNKKGGGGGGSGGGSGSSGGGDSGRSASDVTASVVAKGAIVKALLCAALYPQVVVVESGSGGKGGGGKGGGKGKGGGGAGAIKFKIREAGASAPVAVALHPSSVNARESRFESPYLVYAEKVKTAQIYVRDSSPVSPYALMLFGGLLEREGGSNGRKSSARSGIGAEDEHAVLTVDSWIKFRVPRRVVDLLLDVRERVHEILKRKIEKPGVELSTSGQGLLDAVSTLLGAPPPDS